MRSDGVRMRSKTRFQVARFCGLALCCWVSGALAISAGDGAPRRPWDEVIAKNIQAHGGLEKIKAVNTLRNSAKAEFRSVPRAKRRKKKQATR